MSKPLLSRSHATRRLSHRLSRAAFFGGWLALASCAFAQSASTSPFVSVPDSRHYPDGSRLAAKYAAVSAPRSLAISGPITEQSIHAGAATAFQADLPAGYSLIGGSTTLVMAEGQQAAAGTQAKYFSLHALAYKGVPLAKGSDHLAVLGQDGRVLALRLRGIPTSVDATKATVSAEQAVALARRDAGAGFSEDQASAADPQPVIWVDQEQKGHLAWKVVLAGKSPAQPVGRAYWIAATADPRVLNWEDTVYHTHFGTITGTVFDASSLTTPLSHTLPQLTTTRTGAGGGTAVTGPDGRYAYSAGTVSATISAALSGPYFVIQNQAGANMTRAKTGLPTSAIDLNFGASGEFELAQPTAFYWANVGRAEAGILASTELPALPTRVNLAGTCNAYWDGASINFYRAGGGCPNMAYADVVLHEYGHGIDSAKGGILDGGYSEGFGDAVALLVTRQPCVGRDFFGAGTCLRMATDAVTWPSPSPEVHEVGRRYAGFVWDLVQQLKKTYADDEAFSLATRLVMAASAANPASIPDAVQLSFVADDTDNNLATCSPHFREIAAAADLRHIPRPADCVGGGDSSIAASAQFPWVPALAVTANSNIASATVTLDRRMEIHLVANSSARATGAVPADFNTGFYIDANPSVMWTNSYRSVTVPALNQWVNFGSTFAVTLNPGTYTFYSKIWTSKPLQLSAGSLLVEAFPAGPVAAMTLMARPPAATAPNVGVDGLGLSITRAKR
jgi:hypothetical protein